MKILTIFLLIITVVLSVQLVSLNQRIVQIEKERDQAQKIVDTFSTFLETAGDLNSDQAERIKNLWWKIFHENNYTITGKFCGKDESGECVE
jgi:hypothetical protein